MANDQILKGFKALMVKHKPSSLCSHTIYIKQHSVREHSLDKPPGRTLFILNVPPFIREEGLSNVFSEVGNIETIILQNKPSSSDALENKNEPTTCCYHVAYVVFKKKSDLQKALYLDELQPAYEEHDHSHNGVVRWIQDYNSSIPNVQKLKEEIEEFMANYDKDNKEKLEQDKAMAEPDEDGWVTVTRQGRKPGFERKDSVGNKIMNKEKNRQQKRELKNFYTFQIRESKMKHIVELRQKFEEDKKKIAKLKESRRFKPF